MGNAVKIVGRGAITPLGARIEEFTPALSERRAAAGPLKDFRLSDYLSSVKTYIDRASALALAACSTALKEAGWDSGNENSPPIGLSLGTVWGCLDSLKLFFEKYQAAGPRLAPPLIFPHAYANAPNSLVSIEFELRGLNLCVSSGNVSGALALGHAMDAIRLGRSKRVLAGATDALSPVLLMAPALKQERLSEAAAVLALADEQSPEPALGWLLGWGAAYDPDLASGLARAAEAAILDAGISRSALGGVMYQFAAPDSRRKSETDALQRLFGGEAMPPELLDLKLLVGETTGVATPLAVVVVSLLAGVRRILILNRDPGGSAVATIASGAGAA